ncbi:MAG: hypothetical protein IPK79_08445 [Vampirovibrionales bacterium]|nr:hypothetical protein [Vampirovibrionales bacterium]
MNRSDIPSSLSALPGGDTVSSAVGSVFRQVMRHRGWMIAVALTVWILTAFYVALGYHPKFTSQASVLIRDSAITARYVTNDPVTTTSAQNANPVLNAMELLKSDAVRDSLWLLFIKPYASSGKGPNVYPSYADWAAHYGDGKAFIKAKNPPGTDVISMAFTWSDPALAQRGLATVFTALQNESRRINQSEHRERYAFLNTQRESLAMQLAAVRQRIAGVKRATQTADIQQSIQNYARGRVDLELAAATANAEADAASARFKTYQKSLGMTPEKAIAAAALGRNNTLSKLYDKSYELSEQLASLTTRYTPQSKPVQQVKAQLTQVRGDIEREIRRSSGGAKPAGATAGDPHALADETRGQAVRDMLDAQAQSHAQRLKADTMKSYLTQIDARMQTLPKTEEMLANLRETEMALSQSLSTLEQQTLDARLREAQTLSNVFMVDAPSRPMSPTAPTRAHLIALGLLMGLLAGIAAALLREKLAPVLSNSRHGSSIAFAPPSGVVNTPSRERRRADDQTQTSLAEPVGARGSARESQHASWSDD